jgi:hypothetical protein
MSPPDWKCLDESLQQRSLLEEAVTACTVDESTLSIIEHCPLLIDKLGTKGVNQVRGQLAQDQKTIALLESKGVEL